LIGLSGDSNTACHSVSQYDAVLSSQLFVKSAVDVNSSVTSQANAVQQQLQSCEMNCSDHGICV